MGIEQIGLDMGQASGDPAQPWRRTERAPGGPLRVVLVPHQLGRAPDTDLLAQAGIALHEQLADLASLAENAPLLTETDAIVVEVTPGNPADLDAFDRLIHVAGDTAVIAAVDGLTVASTRQLLRAGAVDVLPIPFSADELKQAVEPVRRPVRPAGRGAQPQRRHGKVVAFLGALGGVGATSIATQLSVLWAGTSRVGLLDLDIQGGNAALYLDLKPSLTLAGIIEEAERLDSELLQSVAVRHASGLEVVASPADIMPLDVVNTDIVDQLLRTAVQAYDLVLVDLPPVWTEWSVRVLQRADLVVLVGNTSVAGIYQARRQLEMLEANGISPKLQLVANRVAHSLFRGKADLAEPESVLGRRFDYSIANDYPSMSSATNEGRALKDAAAGSRLLKDLKHMAARIAETLSAEVAS